MSKFKHISVLVLVILAVDMSAQTAHRLLQDGDNKYQTEDYIAAEEYYRKAKEKDSDLKANFNLGNAIYRQERFDEAVEFYEQAVAKASDENKRSNAYYNLGNAQFQNQDFEGAVESYKKAIKQNPRNDAAKYNLATTKEVIKQLQKQQQEQQQQENQDQQDQQQQDQNQNQDQQQQQENQDQQDQNQEPQDQQEEQQDSTQQIQPSQFDSTRLDKQSLDSTDAQKLLQIIQDEERKVQEKMRKFNSKRKKPDKDW